MLRCIGFPRLLLILIGLLSGLTACAPQHVASALPTMPGELTPRAYLPIITSPLWRPALNTSWQIQFDTPVDLAVDAQLFDIDMFDNDAAVVAALHTQGHRVVCYISMGSWEEWRPDADQFPPDVLGNDYVGWPGEKWLDIRQIDLLAPIMRARMDACRDKGFDGIDPDNLDGYAAATGFPLTAQDQINYNVWLVNEAHARGLAIGLKNDVEQIPDLQPYFDWVIAEACFDQGWCDQLLPFVNAGKAVFAIEYTDAGMTTEQFCPQANALNFNGLLKHRDLDAWRQACR